MLYKLFPVKGVDDDISSAVEWYESKQKGLGEKFIDDWENTVNYVVAHPLAYSKKNKNIRYALLKSFPYLIVYEIINDLVVIYAVVNGKQHPKKFIARKKNSKKH